MKYHFKEPVYLTDIRGNKIPKTNRFGVAIEPVEYTDIIELVAESIYAVPKIEGIGFLKKADISLKMINRAEFELSSEELKSLTKWIEEVDFLSGNVKYQFIKLLQDDKK